MSCVQVGTKVFDCSKVEDPLCQDIHDYLNLSQSVERDGTEWNRSLSDDLGLFQSDYLFESPSSTLSLVDSAVGNLDLPESLTSTLVFSEIVSVAGGRQAFDTPIDAIFDSNTVPGQVVYVSGDGTVDLAQADAVGTSTAIGIALTTTSATEQGQYRAEGQVEVSNWTAITGTALLTPGSIYFLSTTVAGGLTTTAPSTAGETIVRVGRALTTTRLDIEIAQPVLL